MKQHRKLILTVFLVFFSISSAMAMSHESNDAENQMILLGNDVQNGVKAMAHLKDIRKTASNMGLNSTHHIMVIFVDELTGEPIESGTAAVKVTEPTGNKSGPIMLMGMEQHFGADLTLEKPGDYHFSVGAKLADDKKRQFDFDVDLK